MNNLKNTDDKFSRRNFFKISSGVFAFFLTTPAFAFNFDKLIKEAGKPGSGKKVKSIFSGLGDVVASQRELDYDSEFAIGEAVALEGFQRYGLPIQSNAVQKYNNVLGNALKVNSIRPKIPYYFAIIKSPIYNAFACPGGIIFLTSALFKLMSDEAELAGVLSHEIAHVAHKHALQSIKRAKFFQGVGKITASTMKGNDGKMFQEMIGELQNVLFDKGLDKNMEFEADQSGMEFAYRTGYDPGGLVRVLSKLVQQQAKATKKGSWFSTHPPLSERISKCNSYLAKKYPDSASMAKVPRRFQKYKKMV